ncbi:MAG: nucleotidyltransferase domain-containing protein [Candidatus Rokubacteria bacterium]|nr:nucleotidyltransferase domain-containing protein [Candidatus Rokubacteria bacterium]
MPVRSLSSSVLKWPDRAEVDRAVRRWAARVAAVRPETLQIGYFGSYARGDWGPGSDLDIVVIVEHADEPFERRAARWDSTELPVPADVLVYTAEEWRALAEAARFAQVVVRAFMVIPRAVMLCQ